METFVLCRDEGEGKRLSLQMMSELGFKDPNIVFIEHQGLGARVRVRGYIFKPGDRYGWLFNREEEKSEKQKSGTSSS